MRRGAMNRFFSKESVQRLEPIISTKPDKLLEKLEGLKETGRAINVNLPFSAFAGDVTTEYCFTTKRSYLDKQDFNEDFVEMTVGIHGMAPVARQFVLSRCVWIVCPTGWWRGLIMGLIFGVGFDEYARRRRGGGFKLLN